MSCKWNWVNCVSCKILGRLLLLEFSYVETMIELSTRKICSVSTSEIEAGKEQFDHEVNFRYVALLY